MHSCVAIISDMSFDHEPLRYCRAGDQDPDEVLPKSLTECEQAPLLFGNDT